MNGPFYFGYHNSFLIRELVNPILIMLMLQLNTWSKTGLLNCPHPLKFNNSQVFVLLRSQWTQGTRWTSKLDLLPFNGTISLNPGRKNGLKTILTFSYPFPHVVCAQGANEPREQDGPAHPRPGRQPQLRGWGDAHPAQADRQVRGWNSFVAVNTECVSILATQAVVLFC